MPPRRHRPKLTVTIEPELHRRVYAVTERLPGATVSGVVEELLATSLPVFEKMVATMHGARREDGSLDEEQAHDDIARWIGAQLLGLSDTSGSVSKKEDDS